MRIIRWLSRFGFLAFAFACGFAAPLFAAPHFVFTPWETTSAARGKLVPIPPHNSSAYCYQHFLEWAPAPDPIWTPAVNPRTLDFYRDSGLPYEKKAVFYYFRTILNVPPGIDPRETRLLLDHIDDGLGVFANGKLAWRTVQSRFSDTNLVIPIGAGVHSGTNAITLLLADWCVLGEIRGARFTAMTREGRTITAALTTDQPNASLEDIPKKRTPAQPSPAANSEKTASLALEPTVKLRSGLAPPTRAVAATPNGPDDWLRPRRDAFNTVHSDAPLALPPHLAWSFSMQSSVPSGEARILGDRVFIMHDRTLTALDLKTGHEAWSQSGIIEMGDATEDGKIVVYENGALSPDAPDSPRQAIALLNASDGFEEWRLGFPDPVGPFACYQGILYFYDRQKGLQRVNLSDGSIMPTATAPLGGWTLPAFTDDQILFGDRQWLYALYLPDPQRGTKFYAGGINPVIAGSNVLSEGCMRGTQIFRREGKWLRPVWNGLTDGEAMCWLPGGSVGRGVAHDLAAFDAETGQSVWQIESAGISEVIAAGNEILRQERRPSDPTAWYENSERRVTVFAARDGDTGKLLWESEAWSGRPLAASRGYLLVSRDSTLLCLH